MRCQFIFQATCVWPTFSPRDDETKRTVWWPDKLQLKGSVGENLCDSAHWAHQSGGEYILNTQGPVKLQLGTVGAARAENPPPPCSSANRKPDQVFPSLFHICRHTYLGAKP